MTFQLTKYQEMAVRELLDDAKKLLQQTGEKKLVFKAPTGSGKTIIMAEFLARFADDTGHSPCAFIWTAPRQLHEQSKEKIEAHFEHSRAMDCSFFEDLNDRRIGENEILFFNWESIRQNNNIVIRWDCPRAQVLVLFREWSSPVFSIQTIGRIMRMPEPEHGYHDNEILNYSYVYTNLEDIEIKDDIGRGYVVLHTSKRVAKYGQIELPSVHRERHREQTRLTPLFTSLFLGEAQKHGLEKKIKTKNQRVHPAFISDWKAENIDEIAGEHIRATAHLKTASDMDLQRLFDYFVRKSLSPEFHPEDRSVGRVKEAIYQFFRKRLGMEKADRFQDIISIVLSEDNQQHFKAVIDMTKLAHIQEAKKRDERLADGVWKIPDRLPFGEGYTEIAIKKSVMEPFFSNERWQSEKAFIDLLEKPRNSVSWWFKNGDRDAIFFAVPYKL